jgi:hypothetical protein
MFQLLSRTMEDKARVARHTSPSYTQKGEPRVEPKSTLVFRTCREIKAALLRQAKVRKAASVSHRAVGKVWEHAESQEHQGWVDMDEAVPNEIIDPMPMLSLPTPEEYTSSRRCSARRQ